KNSIIISTVHPGIHPERLRSFAIRPTKALSSLYRAGRTPNSPKNATPHWSSRSQPVALKELLAPWVSRRYLLSYPSDLPSPAVRIPSRPSPASPSCLTTLPRYPLGKSLRARPSCHVSPPHHHE